MNGFLEMPLLFQFLTFVYCLILNLCTLCHVENVTFQKEHMSFKNF